MSFVRTTFDAFTGKPDRLVTNRKARRPASMLGCYPDALDADPAGVEGVMPMRRATAS